MVKVIINGVEYTGNNVTVCDGDVIVDFKKVHGGANYIYETITIEGNADNIKTSSGDVKVSGNVNNVSTESGDVTTNSIQNAATTVSGDITAGIINGSATTISGDIVGRHENA